MSDEIWNNDERPGGVFGITTVQTPRVLLEADDALETERVAAPQRPPAERVKDFEEVELCVSSQAAKAEACRCLRCDLDFTRPD